MIASMLRRLREPHAVLCLVRSSTPPCTLRGRPGGICQCLSCLVDPQARLAALRRISAPPTGLEADIAEANSELDGLLGGDALSFPAAPVGAQPDYDREDVACPQPAPTWHTAPAVASSRAAAHSMEPAAANVERRPSEAESSAAPRLTHVDRYILPPLRLTALPSACESCKLPSPRPCRPRPQPWLSARRQRGPRAHGGRERQGAQRALGDCVRRRGAGARGLCAGGGQWAAEGRRAHRCAAGRRGRGARVAPGCTGAAPPRARARWAEGTLPPAVPLVLQLHSRYAVTWAPWLHGTAVSWCNAAGR